MNKIILIFALLFLCVNSIVMADQQEQTITLKDGSQIKGVLTKIEDGVYTVKTPIIGDVHVAVGDVSTISNGDNHPAAPASSSYNPDPVQTTAPVSSMDQQIQASQKQLLSNPKSVAVLQEMSENPEIMQALQDPELVRAVQNHDYAAVQSNPAVKKLINDPAFHSLLQKLADQQQDQQGSPSL
jgi:hypothetical protein